MSEKIKIVGKSRNVSEHPYFGSNNIFLSKLVGLVEDSLKPSELGLFEIRINEICVSRVQEQTKGAGVIILQSQLVIKSGCLLHKH